MFSHVLNEEMVKEKSPSIFHLFNLIFFVSCDNRRQLRAVEGFLVVALQDVDLVGVRLGVKKPYLMS